MKKRKKLVDIDAENRHLLGEEINSRRQEAGLTWDQLAEKCRVHPVTAKKWGSAMRSPNMEHLRILDQII
ncbi:MAG: helix-turn-helix transcriptional regulator [Nitrospinota bacterium]|nr:helix-turn-helix transcriptional regulator [Nitrospinota bacterium]